MTLSRESTATRNSWIYQWLMTQPEPDVTVINLRETRTVGPFVRALDGFVRRAIPYWKGSCVRRTIASVDSAVEVVIKTRFGQLLARVSVPPESPEKDRQQERK